MSAEPLSRAGRWPWRRWFILAAILLFLCAALGTAYLWWSRPPFFGDQADVLTPANFDGITVGMTQTQVESILGPWGRQFIDLRSGGWSGTGAFYEGSPKRIKDGKLTWSGHAARRSIAVDFIDGKVVGKQKLGTDW
jgi:hypothetical protein